VDVSHGFTSAMIGQVRTARPAIMLGGVDFYNQLAPYLITFKYEDNCDGQKADDLSFELADRDGKFTSTWMPQKGANLSASIIASRWFSPVGTDITLDCGQFWIDTVEFKLPERTVTVKANSIPTDVRLKSGKETRGWEKTTLKDIANQIAGENNMTLVWNGQTQPRYGRTEMHEESSLGFLMKRCNDAKLAIKIKNKQIIIFDEQQLEEAGAAFSVVYGDEPVMSSGATYRLAGAHFVTKLVDTVKKTKVLHADPASSEVQSGQYTCTDTAGAGSSSPGRGALLSGGGGGVSGGGAPSTTASGGDSGGGEASEADETTNEDVDNESSDSGDGGNGGGNGGRAGRADGGGDLAPTDWSDEGANLKAKANARNKNKKKDQCRLELGIGNPLIAAGQCCNVVGCGQFDGLWFVESAQHTVGPAYKTELIIRRCLTGY
jgi:phage protein D